MTIEQTEVRDSRALQEARARRADLHHVLVDLERAIAGPAPGRLAAWAAEVHEALVEVGATFERHIAVTEGSAGLFAEVMETAPRLANAVHRLIQQHQTIRELIAGTLADLRALDQPGGAEDASDARQDATELLTRLIQHRQQGADLVYEAYAVDIGVGD